MSAKPEPFVDLEPVRRALLKEGAGLVSAERINTVLQDLLEHEFCDARVLSFLPILLHRAARERLQDRPR